jgi:hypothetical protein
MFEDNNQNNSCDNIDDYDVSNVIDLSNKTDVEVKRKFDKFLDSYSEYLKVKNKLSKSVLERNVIELELIDPSFTFEIK